MTDLLVHWRTFSVCNVCWQLSRWRKTGNFFSIHLPRIRIFVRYNMVYFIFLRLFLYYEVFRMQGMFWRNNINFQNSKLTVIFFIIRCISFLYIFSFLIFFSSNIATHTHIVTHYQTIFIGDSQYYTFLMIPQIF